MDPTFNNKANIAVVCNDDDVTAITSNRPPRQHINKTAVREQPLIAATAQATFGNPMPQYLNTLTIAANKAIADTDVTTIFIMDNAEVDNKRVATKPLKINLPDGTKIWLTHVCDIKIPGLPQLLTGHIVPSLKIASLIGIRPLCKAICKVVFDNKKCKVWYNGKVILAGAKDPATNLWTVPIPQGGMGTTPTSTPTQQMFSCKVANVETQTLPGPGHGEDCAPPPQSQCSHILSPHGPTLLNLHTSHSAIQKIPPY